MKVEVEGKMFNLIFIRSTLSTFCILTKLLVFYHMYFVMSQSQKFSLHYFELLKIL